MEMSQVDLLALAGCHRSSSVRTDNRFCKSGENAVTAPVYLGIFEGHCISSSTAHLIKRCPFHERNSTSMNFSEIIQIFKSPQLLRRKDMSFKPGMEMYSRIRLELDTEESFYSSDLTLMTLKSMRLRQTAKILNSEGSQDNQQYGGGGRVSFEKI